MAHSMSPTMSPSMASSAAQAMPDLLVAVRRGSLRSHGSPAAGHHLVDHLAGQPVQPATAISRAAVAPPRGGRIDSRNGTGVGAPLGGFADDGSSALRLSEYSSDGPGGLGGPRGPGTAGSPAASAFPVVTAAGAAGLASSSPELFRSFLTATDGPGASSMPPSLDHLGDADTSRQTLRRFLEDSTHEGDGPGMDLSAPPPLATAKIDMDELTDRVVRRIERRVVDELERRGRSGARRTF